MLSGGTKYLAALNKDTKTLSARLTPALHKLEVGEAAYNAKYDSATYHGLLADYRAVNAADKVATSLQTALGNTTTLDTALTNFADANPTNAGLNSDVQNSIAAEAQLTSTGDAQVTTLNNDLDTFENEVTVFL